MTGAPSLHYTYEEYIAFERSSDVKHEYVRGLIVAMAGGRPEHGAIAVRVTAALAAQLRGRRCTVFDSDVRVRVRAAGISAYPDASVVCGKLDTDPDDRDAITNPIVIVEVPSPSTEEYDRGDKLAAYQQLGALREVVLVAHDTQRIDVWRRRGEGWELSAHGPGESVTLEALDASLDVDEIYRNPLAE